MDKRDINVLIVSSCKNGFGDLLLTSWFVSILRDNGINAFFAPRYRKKTCKYMDCHNIISANSLFSLGLTRSQIDKRMRSSLTLRWQRYITRYKYINQGENCVSIISQMCEHFGARFGVKVVNNSNYIPVRYCDIPEIPSVDVTLCTRSGDFAKCRNWPYFEILKSRFDKYGVSYIDLTKEEIYYIECLNYVKKSKLYVGLETGTSHYVSQVANGKALILQSGYTDINFWCDYDYDYLNVDTPCRICKSTEDNCVYNNECMRDMSVDIVFDKIMEKIS